MKWLIITCDNSRSIVQAQKHLFKKYVANADVNYIDLKDEPVELWTHNVLDKLDTEDKHIILGLDDFLPIDYCSPVKLPTMIYANDDVNGMWGVLPFDRIELGWGGSRKGESNKISGFTRYTHNEPYRVSCQFSIWNTEALRELLKIKRTPWQFETKGELKGNVLGLETPWRYIEESAISARRPGMVNLCGLRLEDIEELISLKLVDPDKIIYGWRGTKERTKESYGMKYRDYF